MVASALVNTTVEPATAFNCPLLIHAPPAPLIVTTDSAGALITPPVSIFNVLMVTSSLKIGSLVVVAASGIMTAVSSDGVAFGVQLAAVVHELLVLPFQISTSASDAAMVSETFPKVFWKYN